VRRSGRRLDYEERKRKREAREGHDTAAKAQNLRGIRAKRFAEQRHKEKIQMKKAIKAKEERNVKGPATEAEPSNPIPSYLLDRNTPNTAKALSSAIKNRRADKAARYSVPIPKTRGISEQEAFLPVKTGKKVSLFGVSCSPFRLGANSVAIDKQEELEEDDHQAHLRWSGFHTQEP